jgi:hypothetical protein
MHKKEKSVKLKRLKPKKLRLPSNRKLEKLKINCITGSENNVTDADIIERDGENVKIYRLIAERTFDGRL